jgi:hypothetical protein
MENQLIQIYLFAYQIYDTYSESFFQRLSNKSEPLFTDQELITIWFSAHLKGLSEKKNARINQKLLARLVPALSRLSNLRPLGLTR